MEKKDNRGGARAGSGRKSKAEELGLTGKLDKIIKTDEAIKALHNEMLNGNMKAIEMYFHYYYGRPTKEISMTTDINLQNIDINKTFKFKDE